MKKQIYCLFLLFLIFGLNAQGAAMQALETDPAYMKATENVVLLRENFGYAHQGAEQGAQYVSRAGAAMIGGAIFFHKDKMAAYAPYSVLVPYVASAGLGAALGASINAGKRKYTLWKINNALSHTRYNFMTMPMNEAIMVYAAYQKKLPLIKKMKSPMHDFLNEKGIWEALTQLYFGIATPENREKLKVALE